MSSPLPAWHAGPGALPFLSEVARLMDQPPPALGDSDPPRWGLPPEAPGLPGQKDLRSAVPTATGVAG